MVPEGRCGHGIGCSISPRLPCPETVTVALMTDGSYLLVGRSPEMPLAFVASCDAAPLRHALDTAFRRTVDGQRNMVGEAPPPADDPWQDIDGTPIPLFCWVGQVAEQAEPGALFSRLHQRGQVIGGGHDSLYVRFQGEGQVISMPPELLRLLHTDVGDEDP